jgi:hypothetical protein
MTGGFCIKMDNGKIAVVRLKYALKQGKCSV